MLTGRFHGLTTWPYTMHPFRSSSCLSTVVAVLALLSTSAPVEAQIIRGGGVKVGLASTDINDAVVDLGTAEPVRLESNRRAGLVAAAFVEWIGTGPFSIVTEAGYIQKGFSTEHEARDIENNPLGTFEMDDRYDYLTFGLAGKIRVPGPAVAPYLQAGPRLDVLLSDPDATSFSLARYYSSTAIGGEVGAGVEFLGLLPVTTLIELRYHWDLQDSIPDAPREVYNNAVELVVGVRL